MLSTTPYLSSNRCDHISEQNHNEPLPRIAMQSPNPAHFDVKLKSVKEDDEDVLFDEQSIRSLSRKGSNASDCTLETMASTEFEEQPHLSRPPNIDNRIFFPTDSDIDDVFMPDSDSKDKSSITNMKQTDL